MMKSVALALATCGVLCGALTASELSLPNLRVSSADATLSFAATRDVLGAMSQTAAQLGAVAASAKRQQSGLSANCQAALNAFDEIFGDGKKCNQLDNVFDDFDERAASEQLTTFCVTNKCGTEVPKAAAAILSKCRAEFAAASTDALRKHAQALRHLIALSNALNEALCGRTADDHFCLLKLRLHLEQVGWLVESKDSTYDPDKYYGPTSAPTPSPTASPTAAPTAVPTAAPTGADRKRDVASGGDNFGLVAQYMKTGVCLACFDRTMDALMVVLRTLKRIHNEDGNYLEELKADHDIRNAAAFMVLVRFLCSKDGDSYCIDQFNAFSSSVGRKKRAAAADDGITEETATQLLGVVCSNKCLQQFSQAVIANLAPRYLQLALATEETAYNSEVQKQQTDQVAEIRAKIEAACTPTPNVEPCKSLCAADRSLSFCGGSGGKRQSTSATSESGGDGGGGGDDGGGDDMIHGLLKAARMIRLAGRLCLKLEGKFCLALGIGAEKAFVEANACEFSADSSPAAVFEQQCTEGSKCRAAVQGYLDKVQCCFDFFQWALAAIEADGLDDPAKVQKIRLEKLAQAKAITKWCELELPEPCKANKLSFTANVGGIDLCALSAEDRRAVALPLAQALSLQLGLDMSVEEVYDGIVRLCGAVKRDSALTLEAGDLTDSQCSGAAASTGTTSTVKGVEDALSMESQTDKSVTVSASDTKCEEYVPESKLDALGRQQAAGDGLGGDEDSAAGERRAPSHWALLVAAAAATLVATALVV